MEKVNFFKMVVIFLIVGVVLVVIAEITDNEFVRNTAITSLLSSCFMSAVNSIVIYRNNWRDK